MGKFKVMIVEDDKITCAELREQIDKLGNYIITSIVDCAEDAIKHAEAERPDIVLMDIVLKGAMDGIGAAEVIRSMDMPVIYLTAYSDKEKLNRAKTTEPFGYIIKPFHARELHAVIEMALYKHKAEKERQKLTDDLLKALESVKVLKGLLPICASCKKIKDENGYWKPLEVYIETHSDAGFTHGFCPECASRYFS